MTVPSIDALLLRLIAEVDLFKQLAREDTVALLRQAKKTTFAPGEVVFEEGAPGHSMYVVIQGSFEVYRELDRRRIPIANVGPGEHFGEIALIAKRPRSASVRANETSVVLCFTEQAIFSEPNAAIFLFRNMARLMAERLIHANEEVILHKTGRRISASVEEIERNISISPSETKQETINISRHH